MYDYVDRPVNSLDRGGRFLVWAMRSWVKAMQGGKCPCTAIAPAFAGWKMISALPSFHNMMLLFNREALEDFAFGMLECSHVHEHEALIIAMVFDAGRGGGDAIRPTLDLVVNEDAVPQLAGAIVDLGRALAVAGICRDLFSSNE